MILKSEVRREEKKQVYQLGNFGSHVKVPKMMGLG